MRKKDNRLAAENIGRQAEIVNSRNKTLEGVNGCILWETKNTFVIRTNKQEIRVLKKGCEFRIDGKRLAGDEILARPHEKRQSHRRS